MKAKRRGALTAAVAGRWEELLLIPLFVMAVLRPPESAGAAWPDLVWLAALLFSAAASYLKYRNSEGQDRLSLAALMGAFLLLFNGVVVLDGGLASPLRVGYFLLLAFFSHYFGRLSQQAAAPLEQIPVYIRAGAKRPF